MIGRLMGDRAVIVRSGIVSRDRLGNEVRAPSKRTSVKGRFEQTGSREGDLYVVDQWRGYMPRDTDVRASDVIETGGRRFTVEGSPTLQQIPGLRIIDHVEVLLKYTGEVA